MVPSLRRRRFLHGALVGLGAAALASSDTADTPGSVFSVRDHGAVGDGATRDTAAIQAAVDAAWLAGGGTVLVPAGRFLSGTIVLRSRVTLHLSPGAVLLGSPRIADYPAHDLSARDLDIGGHQVWALLYADGAEQIAVEGDGVIDGHGELFPKVPIVNPEVAGGPRPRMIFFRNCRSVGLRDVTLRESGMWTVHLAQCERVHLTGLRVTSSAHLHQDGIVIDSCRDAVVENCRVDTLDDAIVLKSSFPQACSNVTIRNCVVSSQCAGIKLGTQSLGGFRTIAIDDCALHHCRLGGLKFQTVDGGDLEDVTVRNVTMHEVAAPISVRRGDRGFDYGFRDVTRPRPVGVLRGVRISGVRATVSAAEGTPAGRTMSVAGLPGQPIEDVVLDGVHVTFPGGGTLDESHRDGIPELGSAYPEHSMFGVLPAFGLWVRHAAGLSLRDVSFASLTPDARPAVVLDDVSGLELTGFEARTPTGPAAVREHDADGA